MDRSGRNTKMRVRVYGQSMAVTHSHGYLVDDFPTGLSDPVGEITMDPRKSTFNALRATIMYNTSGHMSRRSLLFQEALFIMSRLPNLYDRPKPELTMWQYGYVRKDDTQVKLIHPDKEDGTVGSVVPEIFKHDLVIVPLSQIPPNVDKNESTADEGHDKSQDVENDSEAQQNIEGRERDENPAEK